MFENCRARHAEHRSRGAGGGDQPARVNVARIHVEKVIEHLEEQVFYDSGFNQSVEGVENCD